jgi:hypothetical protein
VHRAQQVLSIPEVGSDIGGRQNESPCAAEDKEAHARFLGAGPPFVLCLEIGEGIGREARFDECECKDDTADDAKLKKVSQPSCVDSKTLVRTVRPMSLSSYLDRAC